MYNQENIKRLIKTEAWKDLREFICSELDKLDRISETELLNNAEELAVQIKSKAEACKILHNIFSQISLWENMPAKGLSPQNEFANIKDYE